MSAHDTPSRPREPAFRVPPVIIGVAAVILVFQLLMQFGGAPLALVLIVEMAQEAPDIFMQALCDDLNTPKAMAELFALAKQADTPDGKGRLLAAGRILGLLQADPEAWFASDMEGVDVVRIDALIATRADARAARDFAAADAARNELAEMGVSIEDTPDGTIWHLAPARGSR